MPGDLLHVSNPLAVSIRFNPFLCREEPKHGQEEWEVEREKGMPPLPISSDPKPYKGLSAAIKRELARKESKRVYDAAYRLKRKAEVAARAALVEAKVSP